MNKKQKLSEEIFNQQLDQEFEIFDKLFNLLEALKKDKISDWKVKGNQHKQIHELDFALSRRNELLCAFSIVDDIEKNQKINRVFKD